MKKLILITVAFLSSILTMNAQNWSGSTPGNMYYNQGNVGIGTTNPSVKLQILGSATNGTIGTEEILKLGRPLTNRASFQQAASFKIGRWATPSGSYESYSRLDIALKGNAASSNYNTDITVMTLQNNGNVGIGTSSPDYKLDVLGTIRAQEVKVDLEGADFVFENDYNLRSLEEVESFVKENKHLPEIESAREMEKGGTELGELNTKLLQKIEELTLYMIDINKRVKSLEKENKVLKKENNILKAQ